MTKLYIPIPGTELTRHVNGLLSAFPTLGTQNAAAMIETVMGAYPALALQRGPYVKDSTVGEWMCDNISAKTGVSRGMVKGILNVLQMLAGSGGISPATYNPAEFSTAAMVQKAVKSALSSVVPDSVQEAASGLGKGVAGLGDVAAMLPLFALSGLALLAYQVTKKARR